jgi:hypothetical protein
MACSKESRSVAKARPLKGRVVGDTVKEEQDQTSQALKLSALLEKQEPLKGFELGQ